MRASRLITLTALTLAVFAAGCNFDRKDRGGTGGGGRNNITTVNPDDWPEIDGVRVNPGIRFDEIMDRVPDSQTGLEVVFFAFDSSMLASSELHKIERAAAYLRSNPKHVMILEGHTDERGSAEYNLSLGEFRAQAVRNHLIRLGIDGSRLQTRSFGFEKPAVIGTGEAVWAQNRRAVFAVYK